MADVNPNHTFKQASHCVYSHDASELEQLLCAIRHGHMTGSLNINFSQGTPAGKLEWKEKTQPVDSGTVKNNLTSENLLTYR